MPRDMLLIHQSELLRKIITSYALAEISDVEVDTAGNLEEALAKIAARSYDVVLSSLELAEEDDFGLFKKMKSTVNRTAPFVVVASTESEAPQQKLMEQGIKNYLIAPYTGSDLGRAVEQAFNPKAHRRDNRYNIPGMEMVIHNGEARTKAAVLNISLSGMLVEISYPEQLPDPMKPVFFDLFFPSEYGKAKVEGIMGALHRIKVMSWRTDHTPSSLRVAWKFVKLPEQAEKTLEIAMEKAGSHFRLPEDKNE